MPSIKARIVRYFIQRNNHPTFESPENLNRRIKERRLTDTHKPPERLNSRVTITSHITPSNHTVYNVVAKSAESKPAARILYIHGGAWVFEIGEPHWDFIANIAERTKATVTVPIYPLAPEHKVAEMYDMLQPIYDELAAAKDDAPFWVMGDSAGGTFSIALTQLALQQGKPIAQKMAVFSPGVDCTLVNPHLHLKAKTDPWLDTPGLVEALRHLAGDVKRDDLRMSPIYGPLEKLPKTLIFIASDDLLEPDEELFVEKAKEKGVDIDVVRGPDMLHVWIALPTPEAAVAQDQLFEWLKKE